MIEIRGVSETVNNLTELNRRIATNVVNRSLRRGAKVLQDAVKNAAPKRTGKLKKSIKIVKNKNLGSYRNGKVGLKVHPTKIGAKYFYAASMEYGFKTRSGGHVAGRRFISRSFGSTKTTALNTILDYLDTESSAEISRLHLR